MGDGKASALLFLNCVRLETTGAVNAPTMERQIKISGKEVELKRIHVFAKKGL